MENKDNHIDWDKLLDLMEREITQPASLTKDEKALLDNAREMRLRLNMDRFPTDQGWERFVATTKQEAIHTKRRKLYFWRWAAAAAVLLSVGVSLWWLNTKKQAAQKIAKQNTNQIMLRRATGAIVVLGKNTQTITDSTVHIQADIHGAVYTASAKNSKIAQGVLNIFDTLEVPRGKTYALQLPDGSKVTLNAASKLIFPEAFEGNKRQVYVVGEAYFDIKHDPSKPFVVHAAQAEMTVLGTTFDINTFNKGLKTTLVSGKLMVSTATSKVLLAPGDQAICDEAGSISTQKVDARLSTAWYHGDLFFDNETLGTITRALGRTYNYDFEFKDADLEGIRLTLDMARPSSIEEVLKQIRLTGTKLKININGRTVTVQDDH
ncbi:DUF4974 domain-containing protein [Arachidicoccus ginsenosidivorans]|uniref:DUF4974 domain-containing protein n=1 Tax=Arachidicoccus ginsenosidivorans TaxID=496057 RepID=A0A5B8VRH8_9BACT|nr:FecR domain-containing protein [Arachidicoccus ginsenosidivorans]QEC74039.1 DUF4974 domain-containing protein [Arachidicoccus ginsenosidivorans]